MVQIELWWKVGKGVMKFLHQHTTPMFVVVFDDRNGNAFPVYENHNMVEEGYYEIKGLCPYEKSESRIIQLGLVQVRHGTQIKHIVIEHLMGTMSCYDYDDQRGEEYLQKKKEKITRPYGWKEDTVEKLLFDFKRFD